MEITERQQQIQRALAQDERTQDYPFEIIDESGLITIKGEVPSREARQAAVEIAENQEGVVEVVDDIHLVDKPDESLSPIPNPEKIKYQVNQ